MLARSLARLIEDHGGQIEVNTAEMATHSS